MRTGRSEPPILTGRWWGDPVRETRWLLEAARLTADPCLAGAWRPPGGVGTGGAPCSSPASGAATRGSSCWPRGCGRIGYRPAVCGFMANVDCSERGLERVEHRVAALQGRSGRRVAVSGHSRGGHYARAVRGPPPRARLARDLAAGEVPFHCSIPTLAAVEAARRALARTGRARREECLTYRCQCTFTESSSRRFPATGSG
jgi:triacylglycerol lipase